MLQDAAARRAPRSQTSGTGRRRAIKDADLAPLVLLVDDSEDTRAMYSEFLSYSGLRVSHAVDGDHAVWKVIALQPNIVIMDLGMPVLDGWAATQQLKRHRRAKHIPIIALTGHVTEDNLRRAKEVGADLVLTKPCAPTELLAAIRSILGR